MTDITEEIIEGVIGQIKTDVTEVTNRIYSYPPQNATFPFISFDWLINNIPAKNIDLFETFITF